MKILYGVQATGNGHINRSREVVAALKKAGHEVFVIFSGRDPQKLWDVDTFRPYDAYRGLTFATSGGKVDYWHTLRSLKLTHFFRDIIRFRDNAFDVVITDFEPISARIAKRHQIPCIGVAHQYAFRYAIPIAKWDPLALLVIRYFAPVDYPLGLHYHHFNQPILPPIVSNKMCSGSKKDPSKIVVYLPFENRGKVTQLLASFPACTFFYYTSIEQPSDQGNVHLRPLSRNGFINDLRDCGGVISNAGFTLTSESVYLGKKLLVRPLTGQLEQTSNAMALQKLGLATVLSRLDRQGIDTWLKAPAPAPIHYPDVAQEIAEWITKGTWNNPMELVEKVWMKSENSLLHTGTGTTAISRRSTLHQEILSIRNSTSCS